MFVVLELLRGSASIEPRVLGMETRRSAIPDRERERYHRHLGVEPTCGAERTRLLLDASVFVNHMVLATLALAALVLTDPAMLANPVLVTDPVVLTN